jgi:hypothetical protein
MKDTATLDLFAAAAPLRRRWVPGKVYQYGSVGVIHCFRDPKKPHGVGHNRVCICGCEDCRRERAAGAVA